MMRAARLFVMIAVAATVAGAVPADAGWRSADRRGDDREGYDDRWGSDEAPEISDYVPSDRDEEERYDGTPGRYGDEGVYDGGRLGDGRFRRHRDRGHRRSGGTLIPSTQPYWGTMRPYWKSAEPPGVIHRQPRTRGLRIEPAR